MQKAISLTQKMNQLGQRTNLFIIGAQPPKNVVLPKNIKLIKFLNKNKNINELNKILYKSHFHVLFSKTEAFGVVNCEASAYGLYTITHDIGGIGGAIFNNKNGFRFSKNNSIEHISKYLIKIFKNKKNFIRKSIVSRNLYDEKLNWSEIGKKLESIIIKNILMSKKNLFTFKWWNWKSAFQYAAAKNLSILNNADLILDKNSGFITDLRFKRKYSLNYIKDQNKKESSIPFFIIFRLIKKVFFLRKLFYKFFNNKIIDEYYSFEKFHPRGEKV